MEKATGGIVKLDKGHILGDDHCSHCLPFLDSDYTLDVALMTWQGPLPDNMTIDELKEMLLENLKRNAKIRACVIE